METGHSKAKAKLRKIQTGSSNTPSENFRLILQN